MERKNLVDAFMTRLKSNLFIAVVIIVAGFIIAVDRFTDATDSLTKKIKIALPVKPLGITLRDTPLDLSSDAAGAMIAEKGFFDKRLNPGGKGVAHRYASLLIASAAVVIDSATSLMWQKGGSQSMMNGTQTENYMRQLNQEKFAGFSDWRLPTAEEAMSLMEPQPLDELYISSVFSRGKNILLTADRNGDNRVWTVYFYDGTLYSETQGNNSWVRAVRKLSGGKS